MRTVFVAVTVLVEVPGRVTGVIMMLAGYFLLPCLVAVAMLVEIARRMAWVIVMLAWCFACHACSPYRYFASSPGD